ncbi:hypothetical protein [Enterobacter ludwigii]|jgi:hypothetical protein
MTPLTKKSIRSGGTVLNWQTEAMLFRPLCCSDKAEQSIPAQAGFLNKGTNMADWFIATEGVKVVKDSTSLWPQIFTAGAAFGSVWFGQWLITQREAKATAGKRDEECLYISTELVFLLEQFAEGCARIATDTGHTDAQGFTRSNETTPEIDLSVVSGDWRVLPPRLMYAIHEIPMLLKGKV